MTGPENAIELLARLHLFRPSAGRGGGARDARHLCARGSLRPRQRPRGLLGGRGAQPQGAAACHRPPQFRPRRRHRARSRSPGKPGARAFDVFLKCYERGLLDPHHRRHHRAVAAADRREGADRRDLRHARRGAEGARPDMLIGVPKEVKTHEYRVGLVPGSVRELVHHGHQVMVERGAGAGIGFDDAAYASRGRAHRRLGRRGVRRGRAHRQGEGAAAAGDQRCCGRARCSSPISTSPPTARRPRG